MKIYPEWVAITAIILFIMHLMRKMIPDLCSRVSFFPKLNSELYGAEKYEILGIDYAESSYISELPLMQMADLEIIRYLFLPFRCIILRTYR